MYQKDNKVFTISLYKINQIINKREEKLIKETNKELVKRLLPTVYAKYKDAFLRAALDKLPPYQMLRRWWKTVDYGRRYGRRRVT